MELTDVIKARRSIRKYKKDSISESVIDDILDCARLAPTAINLQPWLIGAVTDKALLKRLAELADHGRFIADAPLCFAVFTKNDQKYRLEDGCAATMNIILAAQSHGLGTCWIAGDKKQYASFVGELLKVPREYGLIALVPCGFPGETPQAKGKKGLAEVTFKDAVKPA